MKSIKYRDVTGVLLHFSQEQLESLVECMPPEQRRFMRTLAETIKQPHEIWKVWGEDGSNKGRWHNIRSYLQFLDLSQADADVSFGVAVVQFSYRARWELANVGLVLGTQKNVMAQVDKKVRQGSIEYSIQRH